MLVVFKPNSSRAAQAHIDWLKKQEKTRQQAFKWYATEGQFIVDCQTIAERAERCEQVVVIGGDGSLHLVINALVGTQKRIALLPAGTGNDFARQFAWTTQQWRDAVFSAQTRRVDLGKISCQQTSAITQNELAETNNRWFHNVGGVGFNAAVVESLRVAKKRHPLSYITAGLQQIGTFDGVDCQVDGKSSTRHLMLVISNGRYFAAGLCPTPKGNHQDGLFDVVAMKGWRLGQRVLTFLAMLLGSRHAHLSYIDSWQSAAIEIKTSNLAIEADGELVGMTPARFECCQGALLLAVPAA
jgi:diacylglycerol kinase (ATP)